MNVFLPQLKLKSIIKKLRKNNSNLKLILGNEIYLCRNGLDNTNFVSGIDRYYHFILLAKDEIGHKQIREISTRAWMRSYMARAVPTYYQDIIGENPGHVIGSTACLGGALPTQILKWIETRDNTLYEKIGIWIEQMSGLFGEGNFFLNSNQVPQKNKR